MFPHKSTLLLSTYLAFSRGPHSYWNVVVYHRATFLHLVVGLHSMAWDSFLIWKKLGCGEDETGGCSGILPEVPHRTSSVRTGAVTDG